jgi:hypothetical protein
MGAYRIGDGAGSSWRLPDSVLAPGGRQVVFLSGLDRRRIVPAGDTASVFGTSIYLWSDSMNSTPGHSRFSKWEFPSAWAGKLADGTKAFSAEMVLADNAGVLDWCSVNLTMPVPGGLVDVSGRDRLRIRATLPKDQRMTVRFCEDGLDCWKGDHLELRGTGAVQDVYDVSVRGLSTDFSKLLSISFEPPANMLGTYRLTVSSVQFYRSALLPHASFQLSSKGGNLLLQDTGATATQAVAYPKLASDESWARDSVSGTFGVRRRPSPGAANTAAPLLDLPAPAFATTPGFHEGSFTARVAAVPGAVVRCAEHGFEPDSTSARADTGIRLDSSEVLRCAAFGPDGVMGPVSTGTFLLGEHPSVPVMLVTVDSNAMFQSDTGLYMPGPNASPVQPGFGSNFWRDDVIPANVEYWDGGALAFSAPADLGIFGNWSRWNAKKSMNIGFKEKYGKSHVDWALFPQKPGYTWFKGFGLRDNGGNCGVDYLRDALMESLTEGRGVDYQLARHVLVFVNGRYWGIYDLRERLNGDWFKTRLGIDASDIDLIKNGGGSLEVQSGTSTAWLETLRWFMGSDLTDSVQFAEAASRVDLDEFSDYVATEVWASNTDWPANNMRTWRRRSTNSPWRFLLFDMDAGLGGFGGRADMVSYLLDTSIAADGYPNGEYSTVFFRRLSAVPAWRDRFLNRICVLMATNFSSARVNTALDSMMAIVQPEIARDQARWGFDATSMKNELARMRSFAASRPAQVRGHLRAAFSLGTDASVRLSGGGLPLQVDGLDVGATYTGTHFSGTALRVKALVPSGAGFAGWSDGVMDAERTVVPGDTGLTISVR